MQDIRELLKQTESCHDIVKRLNGQKVRTLDLPLHPPSSRNTNAIELHGFSGAGKTHLLYHLAVEATLAGRCAIVFDTDLKWDNARLLQLIDARLALFRNDGAPADIGLCAESTSNLYLLDLIYIYRPHSATAFLDDIAEVYKLVQSDIQDRTVRYILVDSISAFYWQAIADPMPSSAKPGSHGGERLNWTQAAYESLCKCAASLAAQLIYTNWDLSWQHLALNKSYQLQIQKKEVLQFTQGLEQAVQTREARQEVLDRGIHYIRSDDGRRRVQFYITQDSLVIAASID